VAGLAFDLPIIVTFAPLASLAVGLFFSFVPFASLAVKLFSRLARQQKNPAEAGFFITASPRYFVTSLRPASALPTAPR
jgi:hypothetical protein